MRKTRRAILLRSGCPQRKATAVSAAKDRGNRLYGLLDYARNQYQGWWTDEKKTAAFCQECGECEPKCPQKIPIIEQLKATHKALSER